MGQVTLASKYTELEDGFILETENESLEFWAERIFGRTPKYIVPCNTLIYRLYEQAVLEISGGSTDLRDFASGFRVNQIVIYEDRNLETCLASVYRHHEPDLKGLPEEIASRMKMLNEFSKTKEGNQEWLEPARGYLLEMIAKFPL
ncbi:MAG: hypothetical protein HGA85_06115, partial [Nanoarchaeota archaeon]|nr:hypothetical protein [Nanoarchaeota archaeon]